MAHKGLFKMKTFSLLVLDAFSPTLLNHNSSVIPRVLFYKPV